MYLPKHQYSKKTLEELGILNSVKIAGDGNFKPSATMDKIKKSLSSIKTEVVITSFGKVFSTEGIDFDKGDFSKAIELLQVSDNNDPTLSDNDEGSLIKTLKLPPTSENRKKGVMQRCFYYNKCTGKTLEISKVQLKNIALNKDKCTELAIADWYIKGPIKDQTVNGYFLEGLETINNRTIQEIKKTIPVIEGLLRSPVEHVEEIFIPSSTEYKAQIKDIVIPSPGKEL